MWEGIDGSEVLVHLCNDYNSVVDTATMITRWKQRVQKQGIATRLLPFGYGDGGGGPTRDHLEYLRREVDLEGVPRVRISHPLDYFHDQEARGVPWRYVGELFSRPIAAPTPRRRAPSAATARVNWRCADAELWGSLAQVMGQYELPADLLDEAWKQVLLNQFHDIIPGSSIHRVYEEAEADHAEVIEVAEETAAEACAALTDFSDDLTVFNSLSWPRQCL
jgi:alpha-mannosidase